MLLSSLDETVIQHGAEFNLGLHKYQGNNYSPNGHKYIREFDCEKVPTTTYRVGGVIMKKEKVSFITRTVFLFVILWLMRILRQNFVFVRFLLSVA